MELICGVVRFDGPPPRQALDAMIDVLARGRTPRVRRHADDHGALAVLDFSRRVGGSEDLGCGLDGTFLAGDVRLDRRTDLAAALEQSPGAETDALLCGAHERWGLDLPDRVDGDYALAFWSPARRRLMCARDVMGVRPLCFAHEPGRWFAFASLPSGITGSHLIEPRPDYIALGAWLWRAWPNLAGTGYLGVSWLPAGHALEVGPKAVRMHRAWSPSPERVGTWRGSPREAADRLRLLTEAAVRSRLPAHGVVAADLSGGLDSSAVAVLAARALGRDGRNLVVISRLAERGDGLVDEREFVDAVLAQEPNLSWTPVRMPPFGTSRGDPDAPATPDAKAIEASCAIAAAAGADVLLTGAGGDECATYNGRAMHVALLRSGAWRAVASEIGQIAARRNRPVAAIAAATVLRPLLASFAADIRDRLRPGQLNGASDVGATLLLPEIVRDLEALEQPLPRWPNSPEDRVWQVANSYLQTRATYCAIRASRYGISPTHPLMDRQLVEFGLSLPFERLFHGGWTRQPFRDAMDGVLPRSIQWRDRKYVSRPDAAMLFADAKPALAEAVRRLRSHAGVSAFIDLDRLSALVDEIVTGADALTLARSVNRAPSTTGVPALRRAAIALRAVDLAQHIARFS